MLSLERLHYGTAVLPGIGGGWSLEVLMLREGPPRVTGQAAGYVWEGGEPFYGTRLGPGWYQSSNRVARGCKVPFSVLRMLMQLSRKPS
jgi:hypothetical protein